MKKSTKNSTGLETAVQSVQINQLFNWKYTFLLLHTLFMILMPGVKVIGGESEVLNPNLPVPLTVQTPDNNQDQINTPSTVTPKGVYVRQIQILDSTVFSSQELQEAVKSFTGRELILEEIKLAADAVTQLYLNNDYLNSRAIVAQEPNPDGIAVIRVIEGKLTTIKVEGKPRINPSYIIDRIQSGTGVPLNSKKLEEQLRLLRLDPLFNNVEASLRPTGVVGQSLLVVRVQETDPFSVNLNVDNYSPPSIGGERLGVELRHLNLSQFADQLEASYYRSTTGGSESFDLRYQVPLNPMNGTLQFRVAPNNSKITESEFKDLGIRASQSLYAINYRQPLVRSTKEELALSLGFTYQDGQTFIFDQLPTPFGIGPDQDGVSRTSVITFGQEYIKRDVQGAWSGRSRFNFGVDLFNSTTNNEPIPDGRFFTWLMQIERLQKLSDNQFLLIQADLQLTPDSLLPSQQFLIGGGQSIRGYRQNARSGDNGFRIAIEDRITVQRDASGLSLIQLIPFVNVGNVWSKSDNPNQPREQTFLGSAGLGLLWNQALGIDHLILRLDYGIPFVDLQDRTNNIQDQGFSFSLRYQP
ncbi:ShlB/FhaC/HecB family hemolysin secretion/activation protein [Cronbergia sp. UHCC 0137]|uniref:ShlB/FhaC/HecB family hemolysin secretion/activation protein n=1 Tax=Cronbergia sp. UHCC 0137 TaxID=3110239 RepID=UPI002B1FE711|nr:ShlB/FhaC/HecB family hemolysin secretion/activation protein [Cronbergia sp. UHCC 0137]MEA5619703.1 ShlB/FhaC/HecB family hemolysin secretion/activation protein [Cronbergia sp. UHCC 0137]